jgi:putative membrane protein
VRERPAVGTASDFRFRVDEAQDVPPPAPEGALPAPAPSKRPGARPFRWFVGSLVLLVVGVLLFDAVDFVLALWDRHWALGGAFAVLLAATLLAGAWSIGREIATFRRLRHVDRIRAELQDGIARDSVVELRHALIELAGEIGAPGDAAKLAERMEDTHRAEQLLHLFKRQVLEPLDRRAYAAVGRAARDVGAVATLMPTVLLDTAVLLWRSVRLVREVAEIYGFRTGLAGTLMLLRRLAGGAAMLAAADVAGTIVVQQAGGALYELFATKLGEGAVAASRAARLGLLAMQLCRAVPFEAEDLPTFRRLMQSLLERR